MLDYDPEGWTSLVVCIVCHCNDVADTYQWAVMSSRFKLQSVQPDDPVVHAATSLGIYSGAFRNTTKQQQTLRDVLLEHLKADSEMQDLFMDFICSPLVAELRLGTMHSCPDDILRSLPPSYFSRDVHGRVHNKASMIAECCMTLEACSSIPCRAMAQLPSSAVECSNMAQLKSKDRTTLLHCAASWIGGVILLPPK
jgi:hypothetical protein